MMLSNLIIVVVCLVGYKVCEGVINVDMITPATGADRHFLNFLAWLAIGCALLLLNYYLIGY